MNRRLTVILLPALICLGGTMAFDHADQPVSSIVAEISTELQGKYASPCLTPTDAYYPTQKNYSMSNIGNIESIWEDYAGKGITVAVIDDGFDVDHPEYTREDGTHVIREDSAYFYTSGSYVYRTLYSQNHDILNESYGTSSWNTHGTNTSTTLAAPMGNGGVVGIAPEADVLAIKCDFSFGGIREAIKYATSKNVDVISMSIASYAESFTSGTGKSITGYTIAETVFNEACQDAYDKGIIVVAAAGNDATTHKSYPACSSHVIGVGALYRNSNTGLAPFTNYVDLSQDGEVNVDILAPGYVYAAGISGSDSSSHSPNYMATQGTSFSCPIVSGAAALWKQKNPNGTPDAFLESLQTTAAGIGDYVNAAIPTSMYSGISTDISPSNISCGRLDIGALLDSSIEPTGITLSHSSLSLYSGIDDGATLTATVTPTTASQTVTWGSNQESVATVDQQGRVTPIAPGEATITATTANGLSASCLVTVIPYIGIDEFVLSKDEVSLHIGDTYDLDDVVSYLPSNATDVDYDINVSDTSVLSLDGHELTALATGDATVTLSAVNWETFEEPSAFLTFHVTEETIETGTAVYTVSTTSSVTSTGTPTGSSVTFNNTYTTANQITSGKAMTLTLKGYTGLRIDSITLNMHSNASKGAGTFTAKVGNTTFAEIPSNTNFNAWYDNSSYGTSWRDVHVTLSNNPIVKSGDDFVITIRASTNSLYCASFSIGYAYVPDEVVSLSVTNAPSSMPFLGELDLSGIIVTATYESGKTANVTNQAIFVVDNMSLGPQDFYVDYDGVGTTFNVFVTNVGANINASDAPLQAQAFIAYLKTFVGSCASSFSSREDIVTLAREYNAMIVEAKQDAAFIESFMDNGYLVNAEIKLKTMVSQYNATLEPGEEALVLHLPNGDYSGSKTVSHVQAKDHAQTALIIGLLTGTAFLWGLLWLIKRRKAA